MAWKELLEQQREGEQRSAEPEGGASRSRGGLIRTICGEMEPVTAANKAAKHGTEDAHVQLPDGYVRVTPVQEYGTSPDFKRKRIGKIITAVIILALAVLLILALLKTGLVSLS